MESRVLPDTRNRVGRRDDSGSPPQASVLESSWFLGSAVARTTREFAKATPTRIASGWATRECAYLGAGLAPQNEVLAHAVDCDVDQRIAARGRGLCPPDRICDVGCRR